MKHETRNSELYTEAKINGLIDSVNKCKTNELLISFFLVYRANLRKMKCSADKFKEFNSKLLVKIKELGHSTVITINEPAVGDKESYAKFLISRFIRELESNDMSAKLTDSINEWMHKHIGIDDNSGRDHSFEVIELGNIINHLGSNPEEVDVMQWLLCYVTQINNSKIGRAGILIINEQLCERLLALGYTRSKGVKTLPNSKESESSNSVIGVLVNLLYDNHRISDHIITRMVEWCENHKQIDNYLKKTADYIYALIPEATRTDYGVDKYEQIFNYVKEHL